MQTYPVIGHLQVVDLEMVARKFQKEYQCIYAYFCGYSHVYVNLKEINGPKSELEESNMDLTETIWHRWNRYRGRT